MATSLEELLAEEGFRRRKGKMLPRASFGGQAMSMPLYPLHDHHRAGSSGVRKTNRTRSDIPHYHYRDEFPTPERVNDRKSRDSLVRQEKGAKKGKGLKYERMGFEELKHIKKFSIDSCDDLTGFEVSRNARSHEIVEVGEREILKYDDVHSNEAYSPAERKADYGTRSGESESRRQIFEKNERVDKKNGYNSNRRVTAYKNQNEVSQKSRRKSETSAGRSNRSSQHSKNLEDYKIRRKPDTEQSMATPALDEAAIRAMISILSGYAKCFIRDEEFRALHRQRCFASLDVFCRVQGYKGEGKVIANLEEAVETVERAAEQRVTAKELKKASLQLSVLAGLNSNDLKDGFTCGIPNYELSACAHFYLSVIYKLQKKDKVAAKHLLQVFVDSPFQARNAILPDLWEHIFLPHLSDLKLWYSKEANVLLDSPTKKRRLKLLGKVYNGILDSGTYQFAVYYKDWLTEGTEAPSLPSIQIPSIPFHLVEKEDLDSESNSPASSFVPQPMVSKTLYDSVFRHSNKPPSEAEGCEEESFDISARGSHDAAVEDNSPFEIVKHAVRDDAASHLNGALTVSRAHRLGMPNSPERLYPNEQVGSHGISSETSNSMHISTAPPAHDYNQLIVSTVVKAVSELQQPENAAKTAWAAALLTHNEDVRHSDFLLTNSGSTVEGLEENCRYVIGGASFLGIPQDFICPLTEMLFEDPVTLETGHTFERSAVINWFGKGNTTCPVTGKTLEYLAVPLTNFILKRVVVNWKKEHYRNLLDLASQIVESDESKDEVAVFILEQLLSASNQEERTRTAKQLMSLGGLQFLLQRFQWGHLEEKTRVSALLLNCILAVPDYRNEVARNIEKLSLLELLHSRQLKSQRNAVALLTQIICLNRRKDAKYFLDGLQKEETMDALHELLIYLQNCAFEERALVAVLLLHLDLLVEPQEYSACREEAVDTITVALESSLTNDKVRAKCCRALLILGGHFSFDGKIMTEDWILKQAGFLNGPVYDSPDHKNNIFFDESIMLMEDADEEQARDTWLMNLSASLLGDGNKSFLEATAKCLVSENPELVRVCLTTVAWLSSALASLSEADFQLSAFSALISGLKGCLENELVEHKILACMSLLNFCKFPECKLFLMTMAEDIVASLESLTEVTWTAKELYSKICI